MDGVEASPEHTPDTQTPRPGSGAMFDRIAERYDLLNRILSVGIDRGWRRQAVRALALGDDAEVLDVATGTGDLAIDIARATPGARVRGIDPSGGMLEIGRRKVSGLALDDRVVLEAGDAQALPFEDDRFDGCSIAFGIRNVPDRLLGLKEMARVTRPGGRVVVLELGEPKRGLLGKLARLHIRQIVPRVGALLSGAKEYRYLQTSVAAFPEPDEFERMMVQAGLRPVERRPLTFGSCNLYVAQKERDT